VLCTNLGGTPELVKGNGVVLDVDKFWNKKYLDTNNLDNVSSTAVSKGVKKIIENKKKVDSTRFDIEQVAKKYREVIMKVVNR
jgi:glycosyltransferase involved in cell wall biosynthesis